MPDTNASIYVECVGADEAATSLKSASQGLETITTSSNKLQEAFSKRFEHIGLQVFAGEALRASGVGMETRAVVSTLGLALNTMAASFGAAAVPIFLTVTALVAVGGIIAKIVDHQKSLEEALKKNIESNDKLLKSYQENIKAITDYETQLGHTVPWLDTFKDAQEKAKKATDDATASLYLQQIAIVNSQIVGIKEAISANEDLTNKIKNHDQSLKAIIPDMKAWDAATTGLNAKHAELENQLVQTNAKLKDQEANVIALHHGYSNMNDMLKDHTKALKDSAEAAKKAAEAAQKAQNQQSKEDYEFYRQWSELHNKMTKQATHDYNQIAKTGVDAVNTIEKEQANAFASMLVKGKSFADATAHLWSDMETQIIAAIEEIIVKLTIMYALESAMGLGGLGSIAGKIGGSLYPGNAAFAGPQATGGDYMVSQPTLFMAGEAGPERATFTPLSQMGGGGGGGGQNQIGPIQVVVNGVQDPSAIADKVGQAIAMRIRGRGDIAFARPA